MKKRFIPGRSIAARIIWIFIFTTLVIVGINIYMYMGISRMMSSMDDIYKSNISLTELAESLDDVQSSMTNCLMSRTTENMQEYYRSVQDFKDMSARLNTEIIDSRSAILERNIGLLAAKYIDETELAIEAKRGNSVEKYKYRYDNAAGLYRYMGSMIDSLSGEQMKNNAESYSALSGSLNYVELINISVVIFIGLANIVFVMIMVRSITKPLRQLAATADKVSEGDYEVDRLPEEPLDEVGTVGRAFNHMLGSIRDNIEQIRINLITEQKMREREYMMESKLREARLRYLQAQINPHFLFNTLNAGTQLAVMEDAPQTHRYIQKVADFFRYNVKKDNAIVTLGEELELVDTYIYILNVRFAGEIRYVREVDESVLGISLPSMTVQPIVENSYKYGIRNIQGRQGEIRVKVYRVEDTVCISISDNGCGMSPEDIEKAFRGEDELDYESGEQVGIGIANVIGRLRLFTGEEDVMSIVSEGEDRGTETIIYINAGDLV